MLRNILFQLLALISNIVTQPGRQASFRTVWELFETSNSRHSRLNPNTVGKAKRQAARGKRLERPGLGPDTGQGNPSQRRALINR